MSTHQKRRLRVTAAITLAIGSSLLGGTTSAITSQPAGHSNIQRTRADEQRLIVPQHLRGDDAPFPEVHSACSTSAALTAHTTAGGRITYR
jgi:hypothetical protein